jgi:hypothetical protein
MTKTKKLNKHAQAMGRIGGSRNTPAQQAARRRNALNAGPPARVCAECGEPVYGFHRDRALDATCPAGGRWVWVRPKAIKPVEDEVEELAVAGGKP